MIFILSLSVRYIITLICKYWNILVSLRINATWSWCMILLMYCWICNLLVFCWAFLHQCSQVILACDFLGGCDMCLVLVSGWCCPHRMSLGVFFPQWIFWRFSRRIHLWSHRILEFCLLWIFYHSFTLVLVIGWFIFSVSYWFIFGRANLLRICFFYIGHFIGI